ncbi:MAG TPA: SRPBCC domain-containing protein [Burkholderiales bacterium]|nr:SRPBCC domain-containing protein [Burkholderiales bacterium]
MKSHGFGDRRFLAPGQWPPAIRVTRRYPAAPDRVFAAWLDPSMAARWLFATAFCPLARAAIDARIGGSFCFTERHAGMQIDYTGQYVEIAPPRRLAFTLSVRGEPQPVTRVAVEIMPLRTGCVLHLTHDNVPTDSADRAEARWTGILYGLGVALERATNVGIGAEPGPPSNWRSVNRVQRVATNRGRNS